MAATAFSAAILAGGRGTRMGSDKALLEVDGVAMAQRVADALIAAGAGEVFTVGGPDRGFGWRHVADQAPGEGPLGGIVTALGAAVTDVVVVVACDLPWLDVPTVRQVVDALDADALADVAMARTERREPLCSAWRAATAEQVLAAAFTGGERAVHRAVDGLTCIDVPVGAKQLTNVNTPDDLRG